MKLISAILLAVSVAAPVTAADFSDLQCLKASSISKVNPFPAPGNPDSCYLTGMQGDLCSFKCRSGETFQAKPVKPQASSIYEKCGGGDYRAAGKQQLPDAGSILNQINSQHNNLPQPQTTLDYCIFTEFKNNKCLFKCESGAILTEPAVKPDFSTGEPAGACATHIIRPIPAGFHTKAAADMLIARPLMMAKMQSNTLRTVALSLKGLEQLNSPDKAPADYTRGVEEASEAVAESLISMDEAIRDRDSAMLRMETIRLEPTIEKLAKLAQSIEGEANYSYWAGNDIKRIAAELGRNITEIRMNAPFAF